ncbi:MAG: hypothetical protein NTV39_04415 [Candidatus Saccharibacteria bacterium]|nr:hypothetical protein [Candidatus Saccharibacteria bacterium]
MEDIKKPEIENENNLDEEPQTGEPHHGLIDESNKYGSSYVPNVRIDMKPTTRLDATPPTEKKPGFDGAALVVLQWLSYALWGFTVIAMSTLAAAVLTFYITGSNIGDVVLYSLAAVLVLLPISLICDVLYLKNEPDTRTRSSSVVMTVHAVLLALLGIGSLITIAFSLVSLIVGSTGHDGIMVTLYTSLIVALLFGLLFLRTVLPKKYSKIRYFFMTIMVISVVLVCVFGIFGPIADAQVTRNDKLIEANLPTVGEAITTYATDNNQLPPTLSDLKLTGDAKKIVTDKLVTYKIEASSMKKNIEAPADYYYQLCVTYKKASADQNITPTPVYGSSSSSSANSMITPTGSDYSYYVTTVPHPAGDKCYKLTTYSYDADTYSGNNI